MCLKVKTIFVFNTFSTICISLNKGSIKFQMMIKGSVAKKFGNHCSGLNLAKKFDCIPCYCLQDEFCCMLSFPIWCYFHFYT